LPEAELKVEGAGTPDPAHLNVLADSVGQYRVLVALPPSAVQFGRRDVTFRLTDNATRISETTRSMFVTKE